MKQFLFCCCLLGAFVVQGQTNLNKDSLRFPASFQGQWKGRLTWTMPDKTPQVFTMQLQITPADSGYYHWQIIYGDDQKDNRPYLLKPIDPNKGHWVIDELNSIVLDSYWIGNRLIGAFSLQGSTIIDQYWIEADGLHVEFISFASKPITTTGGTNADTPPVDAYQVKSVQRGVLKRIQ